MELNDLLGSHVLSGVDNTTKKIISYYDQSENITVVRFILDGITYEVVEDPDDGYRSYCKEIILTNDIVINTFMRHQVIVKSKGNLDDRENNIIQFIDVITNKVVLELGTDYSDDYYPCCIMDWNPENLAININK